MAVAPSFDLGMGEWTEEAEEPSSKQPPKKKLCLSLFPAATVEDVTAESLYNGSNNRPRPREMSTFVDRMK